MNRDLLPRPFILESNQAETPNVVTLNLVPEEEETFLFQPGQFNMLYLFGLGEVPLSLSSDPGQTRGISHTLRVVGGVTRGLAKSLPGSRVGVRGPFGNPWPLHLAKGKDLVLLAGGIGLAPLRPVIYHVLRHRQDFGRLVVLVGARSPEDLLYYRSLAHNCEQGLAEFSVIVDKGNPGWKGRVGVITHLVPKAELDPAASLAFLCGPEIMMRFGAEALLQEGLLAEQIFVSMERNMKCGVGACGHCQHGASFVCKNGPVYSLPEVETRWNIQGI